MKLKQVKEFNSKTITPAIAARICAVAGLWRGYLLTEYQGFKIIDKYVGRLDSGTVHTYSEEALDEAIARNSSIIKEPHGVEITPLCGTSHIFRIWPDGHVSCRIDLTYSDFEHWVKRGSFESKEHFKAENPCNQISIINLYFELGFYSVEL